MKHHLPEFPKFEKLSLEHKDLLQAISNNFPSSDFNFAGLFTWDINDVVQISNLNDNVVIRTADYLTHEIFYSFIGDNEINETVSTLTKYAKNQGHTTKLKLITEKVAKDVDKVKHVVLDDRDNYDYVYSINDLVKLEGSKYQKHRLRLNKFKRLYGDQIVEKELDLSDKKVVSDLEHVMNNWKKSRQKKDSEVIDEFKALKKALDNHEILSIKAFGVYYGQDLIAFTIFEIIPGKIAVIHFDKADTTFKNVFVHLKHSIARHLDRLEVKYINYEQDLGIPGLREAKEFYHPHSFIKKYTVERKN